MADKAQVHVPSDAPHDGSGFEGLATRPWRGLRSCTYVDLRRRRSAKLYHMTFSYAPTRRGGATKDATGRTARGRARSVRSPSAVTATWARPPTPRSCVLIAAAVGRLLGEDALEQGVWIKVSSGDGTRTIRRREGERQAVHQQRRREGLSRSKAATTRPSRRTERLTPHRRNGRRTSSPFATASSPCCRPPPAASTTARGRPSSRSRARPAHREGGEPRPHGPVDADRVFFTGKAAELRRPQVDDREVGEGHRGPVTKELQAPSSAATKGENDAHPDWLTDVD